MYQPFNGYYNGFNGVGSINIPPQQQMGVQSVLTPSMTITRVNGEKWDKAHAKYIEKAAWIKQMLAM